MRVVTGPATRCFLPPEMLAAPTSTSTDHGQGCNKPFRISLPVLRVWEQRDISKRLRRLANDERSSISR